uniref:Uncharacterized protein n=2 Tax=Cacopsylla melanoneura TaxID=428564 RepID=A0A8D9DWE2_9HEMI
MNWYRERGITIGKEFCMGNKIYPQNLWFNETMWRGLIVTVGRIRCGHGLWPTYLYKMGMKNDPLCTCGEEGTIDHIILGCTQRTYLDNFYKKLKPHVVTFPINVAFLTSDKISIKILYSYILREKISI